MAASRNPTVCAWPGRDTNRSIANRSTIRPIVAAHPANVTSSTPALLPATAWTYARRGRDVVRVSSRSNARLRGAMTASLLIAFDGSAAAKAAVRAAGALFPGARATVLMIHEPAISPMTTFRVGGALMSPELVERNLTELERELVADAEAAAADGVRLAEAAGLTAEPEVAAGERQPWGPILAAAAERSADVVVCGTRGHGAVARSVLGSTSS